MSKIKKGDYVKHDFSQLDGEVIKTRTNLDGYNYLVRWTGYIEPDWYQEKVLVKL